MFYLVMGKHKVRRYCDALYIGYTYYDNLYKLQINSIRSSL